MIAALIAGLLVLPAVASGQTIRIDLDAFCSDGGRDSPAGTAEIRVRGSGVTTTHTFDGTDGWFRCQRVSDELYWLRLAPERAGDGGEGPHLDVDLCGPFGDGRLRPMNPRANPCPTSATWGVWWHDDAGIAYANRPETECALTLEPAADSVVGTFECSELVDADGTRGITLEGRFVLRSP